jgi:hypothetical protein
MILQTNFQCILYIYLRIPIFNSLARKNVEFPKMKSAKLVTW